MPLTKVLYISYDGIGDPLGRSQVLPYIKNLSQEGVEIYLVSFEKNIERKNDLDKELSGLGIRWIPLRYHKGPIFAKIWDIAAGMSSAGTAIRKNRIRIVHSRGYVAGFIAMCLKKVFSLKFIFDMRGLWVDEMVDAGVLIRNGLRYKIAKWVEKALLLSADEIIALTHALEDRIKRSLYPRGGTLPITIVPTCVDLELFYPARRKDTADAPFKDRFVVSYFGSIGTYYNLSAVLDFYKILPLRFKNAYILIMANNSHASVKKMICEKGIGPDSYYLGFAAHEEVPGWLRNADVSIIFYNRKYSKEGCCPTKLGESLACGVPVIINDGVGDCSSIVRERNIGVVIKDFTEASYLKAIDEVKQLFKDRENLSKRCRIAAEELFSLDSGVEKYLAVYNKLV